MPEYGLDQAEDAPTRLEVQQTSDHNIWKPAELIRFTADGMAHLRYDDDLNRSVATDLSKERYRWIRQ